MIKPLGPLNGYRRDVRGLKLDCTLPDGAKRIEPGFKVPAGVQLTATALILPKHFPQEQWRPWVAP